MLLHHRIHQVVLSAILMTMALTAEAGAQTLQVVGTSANVRLEPLATSPVLMKVSLGTVLNSDLAEGEWYRVVLPKDASGLDRIGFVHRSLVKQLAATKAPVTPAPAATEPPPPPPPVAVEREFVISDGTELRVRLLDDLSSSSAQPDQRVRFEVVDDVLVDGVTVIARGAAASGTVTNAQRKKSFGRRGKLDFTIDYVKAVDGQQIRLRVTKARQGDESYVKAGVVTYLAGPFGALVKGKDVDVTAGTEYTIFIDGERRLHLKLVG